VIESLGDDIMQLNKSIRDEESQWIMFSRATREGQKYQKKKSKNNKKSQQNAKR